jgi:serine-type D-Ala-D-Ala endopeptidase (penicillin-binding protein 7)
MLKITFSFLLLSHALLVNASEDVQVFVEKSEVVSTNNTQKFDEIAPQAVISNDSNSASAEAPLIAEQKLIREWEPTKMYDDLVKIMPVLGYYKRNNIPHDIGQDAKKEELSVAVKKFAAMPRMRSSIVLIYDETSQKILHGKNADVVAPIASITKLMTAMVVLDAQLPLDEEISLSPEDINRVKRTRSRTQTGMTLTRGELLKLALMASDNLSAAALARTYPGGTEAALAQMNHKARELGMNSSFFTEPTGLSSRNVSTASDLVKMVSAAKEYELIQQYSTSTTHTLERVGRRPLKFHNTNPLVKNASWNIGLSKTGYISEAGRCLVMEAKISDHPVIIVLLDSWGKNSRVSDANRVKQWMEKANHS